MKTEKIKVLRAFILDGKPTTVGDVIEVPAALAIELRTAKKAEKVEAQEQAPAPATTPAKTKIDPKAATPQKGEK